MLQFIESGTDFFFQIFLFSRIPIHRQIMVQCCMLLCRRRCCRHYVFANVTGVSQLKAKQALYYK